MVKNPPAGSEDAGLIPGPGRSHMLCGVTKPMRHNYGTHALQLLKPMCPTACAPQQEKPPDQEGCTSQRRVVPARGSQRKHTQSKEDPAQPKNKNK